MDKRETVIVTGSSGLIGYAVSSRLAGRYYVAGFDRAGPPHPPSSVDCLPVDLTSDDSVEKSLEEVRKKRGSRIASVVHLAAYYDFSGKPSPKYDEITVRGTERLIKGLKSFQVEQFLFSSTMLVHAPCQSGQRIDENWPLDPKWAYPESKLKTEELILAQRGGMPAVLLRIAGVYDGKCHSIPIAQQIKRIYERGFTSRVFPGDVSHGQSFIHLEDVVETMLLLVEKRGLLPEVLPLLAGEPETLSYDEIQRILGRLIHGKDWRTYRIPRLIAKIGAWAQEKMPFMERPFIKPWMIDRAGDHYALDIGRSRALLGWVPHRSLRNTLPEMAAALKRDPEGWYKDNKLPPPGKFAKPPPAAKRRSTDVTDISANTKTSRQPESAGSRR